MEARINRILMNGGMGFRRVNTGNKERQGGITEEVVFVQPPLSPVDSPTVKAKKNHAKELDAGMTNKKIRAPEGMGPG